METFNFVEFSDFRECISPNTYIMTFLKQCSNVTILITTFFEKNELPMADLTYLCTPTFLVILWENLC